MASLQAGLMAGAADPTEPRLMIKKIVMENFKSYYGEKTIGPFHKCFSAIVGPNGSGKSNVIDSMLFVFGKRASKIRLKKISELIHKSKDHRPLECRVSVHFHEIVDIPGDSDNFTAIPGSEFVVTRTANKENKSKYYVNRKSSSFTAVTTLLKKKKVDLTNNRFLILQGEVEQISMMKPKALTEHETGLLEYLEEIVGSNVYVEPIEEKQKEVELLNETRQEKANRVQITQKDMESSQGAMEETLAYLRVENKLQTSRGHLYQLNVFDSNKYLAEAKANKERLEDRHQHEQKKLQKYQTNLDGMEASYQEKKAEFDETKKEMEAAKAEFAAKERKDIQFKANIKNEKSKKSKQQAKLKRETKKKAQLEAELEDAIEEQPRLEKQITAIEAQRKKEASVQEKIFEEVKERTGPIRSQMEEKEKELVPHNKKINDIKKQKTVAESEQKMICKRREKAEKDFNDAKTTKEDLARQIKSCKKAEAQSNKDLTKCAEILAKKKREFSALETRLQESKTSYQKVTGKYREAKVQLARQRSEGYMMKLLMGAKRSGKIPGIYGRLGDLGTIDMKYDIAISTACGALDYIVVDNTRTAEKCVRLLRQQKAGRATFLILEKQEYLKPRMMQRLITPFNVKRLFDLVRAQEKKFMPAFYYALRDTLVATDLNQAVKIGYDKSKRWRVVTLKGELIDSSGTMSGGGKSVARGGMKASFSSAYNPGELKEWETKSQDLKQTIADMEERYRELEKDIEQLEKEHSTLSEKHMKLKMELQTLEIQFKSKDAQIEALSKAVRETDLEKKRVKELNLSIKSLDSKLQKSVGATTSIQKEVQALQQKILDAGGAKLQKQTAKVEALSKKLDEATRSLTQSKVASATLEKKIAQAAKKLAAAETEIETCEENIHNLQEDFKTIEEDAAQVVEAYKAAEKQLKTRAKQLAAIEKEYEKCKTEVNNIRQVEVDIVNQLQEYQRVVDDNAAKASHWEEKLVELEEKINSSVLFTLGDLDPMNPKKPKKPSQDSKGEDEKIYDEEGEMEDGNDHKDRPEKFRMLSPEEVDSLDKRDLLKEITLLEEQLSQMNPDMRAIEEYRGKRKEYLQRIELLEQITAKKDAARKELDALRKKRLDEFMAGFSLITMKLKEMYQMLTLGGDAELELVDSLDPFSEGIIFSVRPPKKSWKNIHNLSGGEKTLSSLSLIFALHHFKPTPLYVMDEIDAALDFKNVSIVANYIKERTQNAQFIIISLRNNMFELADRLVGIYKTNDVTKSITIDPRNFSVPLPGRSRHLGKAAKASTITAASKHPTVVSSS